MPPWAVRIPADTINRMFAFGYNTRLVAAANASATTYDLAMYGDSLTAFLKLQPENAAVWDKYFGTAKNWTAARLGVGGSTVEELTWRLMAGGEKFAVDPLVSGAGQDGAGCGSWAVVGTGATPS